MSSQLIANSHYRSASRSDCNDALNKSVVKDKTGRVDPITDIFLRMLAIILMPVSIFSGMAALGSFAKSSGSFAIFTTTSAGIALFSTLAIISVLGCALALAMSNHPGF